MDDFVTCYHPTNRHERAETERFKSFTYAELTKRDKVNLDIFWLKDESLEDSANLPDPGRARRRDHGGLGSSVGTVRHHRGRLEKIGKFLRAVAESLDSDSGLSVQLNKWMIYGNAACILNGKGQENPVSAAVLTFSRATAAILTV